MRGEAMLVLEVLAFALLIGAVLFVAMGGLFR